MNFYLNILNYRIESLRESLHNLICNNELTDSNVVLCSQELDKLLVKYEMLKSTYNHAA
ncbi:MAG: aspartyl-phosphate phosphatase Spo0E family protein [Bacillota bacterium]|nr:aspartyl-phosphate phosphatase Spo0E family protein [Bacillota bacterium]